MFALSVLKIFMVSLVAAFFHKNRLARSWAFVLFFSVAAILFYDFFQVDLYQKSLWFVSWIESPALKANLGLKTGVDFAPFILCAGTVLLFALYYNVFYPFEKNRILLGSLYSLIFVVFLFVVSAGNFFQLLVALCLVDVLVFCLLPESKVRWMYLSFNLIADFALFLLFAFVWGQKSSLYFSALSQYARHGFLPQFVCCLWCFSLIVKCGFLSFHNYLIALYRTVFPKAVFVAFFSSVLVGQSLLFKTAAFVPFFDAGTLCLKVFVGATLLWALCGSIVSDSIKERLFYFYMMFSALLSVLQILDKNVFLAALLPLSLIALLISAVMILPLIAAANEPLVSQTGGFIRRMKLSFGVSVIAFALEIMLLVRLINDANILWVVAFALCHFIAFAHFLGQIYFGCVKSDERVWAIVKNPAPAYFFPILLLEFGVGYSLWYSHLWVWGGAALFFLTLTAYTRLISRGSDLFDFSTLQSKTPFLSLYKLVFIAPVTTLGRTLLLTIDFLFIERFTVALFRRSVFLLVRTSLFLHRNMHFFGWVFLLLALILSAALFFLQKGDF